MPSSFGLRARTVPRKKKSAAKENEFRRFSEPDRSRERILGQSPPVERARRVNGLHRSILAFALGVTTNTDVYSDFTIIGERGGLLLRGRLSRYTAVRVCLSNEFR